MEKISAVIKCNAGEWVATLSLPVGKAKVLHFTKENNFTLEVEKEVTFVDHFGKVKVHHPNWPQHLLDNYKFLELVEVKKEEAIVAPHIVDRKAEAKKKKGSENEKSNL